MGVLNFMKIGNIKFDKKKLGALVLSAGLLIGGATVAISSSINKGQAVDYPTKPSYTVYYVSGDQAFVSNGEQIGYLNSDNIEIPSELEHNYTVCHQDVYIKDDNIGIFLYPSFESGYRCILNKGTKVTLNAYGDDGWAVVNYTFNGEVGIGFVHQSFLQKNDPNAIEIATPVPTATPEPITETINMVPVAVIKGDKVNVRSSMQTGTNNRIGYCNTGDKFTIIDHAGGWYLIDYYGQPGYVSDKYVVEEKVNESDLSSTISTNEIIVAKITGNNVNIRSSMSTKNDDNIIGFCDISDKFEIIEQIDDWYHIRYLDGDGYISSKFVREVEVDREELEVIKMVYLPSSAPFYDSDGAILCYLPENQNILVLSEQGNNYKVKVDGVVGFVRKKDTKSLTQTCIVVDKARQIVRVYKKGKEVFRCKVITGADGRETRTGCFTIGHHMEGYTFPDSGIYNEYWIQFDGNRGFHPANANAGHGWQKIAYFKDNVNKAYDYWIKGRGKTHAIVHGSHGCVNMMIDDIIVLYSLCGVGDNVLVIEQNDLIAYKLLTSDNSNAYIVFDDKNNDAYIWSDYANNTIDNNSSKIKTLG